MQGAGAESPFVGSDVVVRGIVTGDFQSDDNAQLGDLGGFYVQEELPDNDPQTSDGVFVFEDEVIVDVSVGDRVRVVGAVAEFFGETQIAARTVEIVGQGSIPPTPLSMPAPIAVRNSDGVLIADLEPYEGMLVRLDGPLSIVDNSELGRFGALQLAAGEPPQQFTNVNPPDARRYAQHRDRIARSTLFIDDGWRVADVSPPRYLFGLGEAQTVRLGDRVTSATGNVRYSRGSGNSGLETYRLMPVGSPSLESRNPRPSTPR